METRTVYRIEKPEANHGMWYNAKGEYEPIIDTLCPDGISKDFPMDYDKKHRKDGKVWYSSGKSIENMHQWFSANDAKRLLENGFRLFIYVVSEWQEKEMEYLFTKEGVISVEEITLDKIWDI
jgi:hypothetical protein